MSINWRRILLLIGFIGAVVVLGWMLYFFFLRPTPPAVNTNGATNTNQPGTLPPTGVNGNVPVGVNGGALPPGANVGGEVVTPGVTPQEPTTISPVANGSITQVDRLTDTQISYSTLSNDGSSVLYYEPNSGKFYKREANGTVSQLTDQVFYQVQNVTWSPSQGEAILEYPDGANVLYNFTTKKQVTLPTHWKDFSFSPTGNQVVFKSMAKDADNRWLAIALPDGSGAEKIERLGDKDQTVYPLWSPNNQIVAMYSEAKNLDQQDLFFLGRNNERFRSTVIDGYDFRSQWSTNGDKLLYSVYSNDTDLKPNLYIISAQGNAIGQDKRNLKIETWADKCAFTDNNTVYCAVPKTLPEGAGLQPDDFDTSASDIYKIDLTTGFKSLVAVPSSNQVIGTLMATEDGRYMYFTSKSDGNLYRFRLK